MTKRPLIDFLLNQTGAVTALCVMGISILLALGLTWLTIRMSGQKLMRAYSGLVPNVGATLTAGFLLFVALVASTVLRDRAMAEQAVDLEAHALHIALSTLDKEKFPAWHHAIAAYIDKVTSDEWQDMRKGVRSHRAHDALQALRTMAQTGLPGIAPEVRGQLTDTVKEIDGARQSRLFAAADEVPDEVWITLAVTALVMIFFAAAIHAHVPNSAYILSILYGLVIGAMFFTIITLDFPYRGAYAVSAQPILRLATGLR